MASAHEEKRSEDALPNPALDPAGLRPAGQRALTLDRDEDTTMREIHFHVASVHRAGARLFVGGRNCRQPLAVGDVVRGPGGDVRVDAILIYRRYLNILDPGLTGELELSGAGVAAIEPGSDLVASLQTALPPLELLGEGLPHVQPV
jgi:hypothetical protein